METIALKLVAAVLGFASAGCWLYGVKTVSRESELERRHRRAAKRGEQASLGGVQIIDDDLRYDLIATLRHQSQWNRGGAIFAGLAILAQTVDSFLFS